MKTKKPLLTISLLISNRPDTIPRCLDSLNLIMDKIPCELILIDTSKSEEIHKLLLKYTDKVYEFEWCKDFAKARNEGVRRAKGKWFLYLDDDEWFVDVEDILDFFKTGRYKKCECANIQIRNFLSMDYTEYSDSWGTRLFYLGGGAKFEGKVHEYIYPIYGEAVFLQAMAHHSGYVFETEEKKQEHFRRNTQLLLDAMKDDPKNLRWASQLVQEYRTIRDWEAIVSVCKKYIKDVDVTQSVMRRNNFCTLYAGLVESLINLKRHKDALEICNIAFEDERSTDLLKSLLHFYTAAIYIEFKDWSKARKAIEKYIEGYEYFKNNKESMNEQMGSLLVHRVYENDYVEKAYNIMIYSELKKENIDIPLLEDDEQKEVEVDALSGRKFVKAMVKLIATTEYKIVFDNFIKNVSKDETLCNWACAEVQQWENEGEDAFRRLVYAFAKVESDFWYICYCRIMEADIRKDKDAVERAIEELLNVLQVVFYMPERVYEIIDKYDIKVALLWDKVVGEQWSTQIKRLVNECEDIYTDKAYDYILDVFQEQDWHTQTLVSAFQEKLLVAKQREEMDAFRIQIIEQIKIMISTGKLREALQFIEQLQVMFPVDEEVIELADIIQRKMME